MNPMKPLAVALAAGVLAGCGYVGTARSFDPGELERDPGWIAAPGVPLVLQEHERDCGAAALAMVLSHQGVPTAVGDVTAVYPPSPPGGIRAGYLRDFARSRGLEAYLFHGTFKDLEHELSRRRPVVVGLFKRYLAAPMAHYEVVTAIHPKRRIVVTLDPARGWRQNDYDGFWDEWAPSGVLTLVVFRAEDGGRPE